jgi:alpha-beta hydrolase superfamily lysophospholipase
MRTWTVMVLAVIAGLAMTRDAAAVASASAFEHHAIPDQNVSFDLRGHAQTLHLYGPEDGEPVIVSSGDGGWMHLGPHVAEFLANRGYFVVGFDVRAYLSGFTSWGSGGGLRPEDEPGDYQKLIAFAARRTGHKVLLVGVSEGAGLSVLAAADRSTRERVRGVIGLGLGDVNELAWHWRDMMIYLTKGTPKEPSFSAAAIVHAVAPAPFVMIHSTRDEFVPIDEARGLMDRAAEPKKLWVVPASDHRFSDNRADFERALLESLEWIRNQSSERA